LGRAAGACDMDKTAIWIFEDILSVSPSDIDTLRELGRLFYETDEKKASGYFERILVTNHSDKEAHEAVRDLAARATMKQGVEGAAASGEKDSWKQMMKDTDSAKRLEFGTKMLKTKEEFDTAIAYATDQVRKKPEDPKTWVSLGEIHMAQRAYEKAEEAFLKACELDTANPTLRFKVGDARIKRMEARVAELLERAKGGDANAAEEAKKADAERIAFALEDYTSRVRAHPTDLDLRYRYGELLYRGGRWKEAVAEFQHAVRNPKRQKAAAARMADCFERLGNDDLAHDHLAKALEQFNTVDEDCKGILYRLGRLEEKRGKLPEAHGHFMKIFEVDINYRDVSDRVEKTRTKGAG
ncbi:MAG: tetratricopeptide repeat protein, partial [Planctomycetes bacterium]|nr:tetratricopeptide repeat protein [Planctomycetota bacterium]